MQNRDEDGKINLSLNKVKVLIDNIFNDSDIKTLCENNESLQMDSNDLEKLFFAHQKFQIPFDEDGFINLDDEIYEYINSKFIEDINTHLKIFIEHRINSTILEEFS